MAAEPLKEAQWWTVEADGRIRCTLCPRDCIIPEGKHGFCFIRKNEAGRLVTLGYGHPSALQLDPIEKKPLNHFLPGTQILSLGTAGCNLGCRFCQNWDLSKAREVDAQAIELSPERVVEMAERHGAPSLAFTYNDPTIWGEYVIDISKRAHERGIRTVMVTAGYIHEQPFREIYQHVDAANVDLKAFDEDFYYKLTFSHLQPVLDTLVRLRKETDVWFEITNLLIPGHNDSPEETRRMCDWILRNLGADTPLHFTAFHPAYKLADAPPTPSSTLERARRIALEAGLRYVYIGNVHSPDGQTTYCPSCGEALIERDWHSILSYRLRDGACAKCGTKIAGVFDDRLARKSDGFVRRIGP
ncbi:MAG: AmmeMemoRadiSam system radical SAM enzyme [Candidatus Sumerlaeota bacterium]|nr:AmmeMemoRadiSam system radical SAM enzyme [Candidatus Sumerlaeota bacterium]